MFKFLKEKLGNWAKKSKEDIEKKADKKEPKKLAKAIKKKAKKKAEKKIKKEVEEKVEEVIEESKETTTKPIKDDTEPVGGGGEEEEEEEEEEEGEKQGFFSKIKKSLSYQITEEEFNDIFDELEMLLLENNVALEVVEKIKEQLAEELVGKEIKKQEIEKEIKLGLKKALESIIIEPDNILDTIKKIKEEGKGPFKIIFLGINGAGKTTGMAKFANLLKENNLSCVFAAGDTFRAASIEQLQVHADKLKVKMIKQDYNTDPAAVAFDAIKYAENNKIDVVLIDTAGRMHTKEDLLREMEKICRVSDPDIKIFVAESIAGNDATEQAKAFNDMVEIDGSILSKADIDEKGGTIISISHVTNKPIFYLGTGQEYKDLEPFNKEDFIKKLGLED